MITSQSSEAEITLRISRWVESFLTDRRTTLAINHKATSFFVVTTGVSQESPVTPILYIFYSADLLEICESSGTATSVLGFIDDVNILAYDTSTKENVRTLERLHKKCEAWARRHGSTFAPKR